MKESWWSHNTDKLLLFTLVILLGGFNLFIFFHGANEKMLDWSQDTINTVLGALLLILTGRVARADGQTANGLPPTSTPPVTPMEPPITQNAPKPTTGGP